MRVISGTAKSLKLKTIEGNDTRPTTDRIKETLFNMLNPDIPGCRFLDLYSGSGAIGIEALSRGAKEAVFVEKNRKAVDIIKDNLAFTRLKDGGIVLEDDVESAINKLNHKNEVFDIVFLDPPYNHLHEKNVLEKLSVSSIINNDSLIVVEASLQTDFEYLDDMGYILLKEKRYKTNKHMFIQLS